MTESILVEPSINYKDEYIEMIREWEESGEMMVPFVLKFDCGDFDLLIQELNNLRDVPREDSTKVNSSTFWLVDRNKKIIGVVNIRHKLNNALLFRGGHIGYGIRPSERRKGNATEILRQALIKAKELGIYKALITCDKDNIGSVKTITNNGGTLDSEEVVNGIEIQRYWIEIPKDH
ncbi:MAG: GNAT family N-acetyltransferase [Bacillota bacterium]